MKEKENQHQSSEKTYFFLLEFNTQFNRYDIVHRIADFFKHLNGNYELYVLVVRKNFLEHYIYFVDNGYVDTKYEKLPIYGDCVSDSKIYETILDVMKKAECSNKVVCLSESCTDICSNPTLMIDNKCFIIGLHSDIPKDFISYIVSNGLDVICVSLSHIPYLTSQCIHVINYLRSYFKEQCYSLL